MARTFYITTAIDYTNAPPHIGHAYEKVLADVLARYHRLKGEPVYFLTGVDQHGQKVQQSAEKQGIVPQQFVDEVTKKFVGLWEKLDVRYDEWAATTDERHKRCVRAILQKLWDEKDPATGKSRWLYKANQSGYYSVRQEQFLTDKERDEQGEFGPEWGQVEFREEENFYFRLREHKEWLKSFIKKRSNDGCPFVVPDFRVPELLNAVEKLEGDLCVSRPASRLKWGIPFPETFGEGFVTFVWFDALVNYISFGGYEPLAKNDEFSQRWPALHVIGKDILIPAHGVYWPIMLKALGFSDDEMPTLLVHGWWNIAGAKMSKTLGNVVDPDALADKYGAEILRYYLMSDIATGKDADFSEERLVLRYNTDLANSIGNLLNRTLNMAQRYREGKVRRPAGDSLLSTKADALIGAYEPRMVDCECHVALGHLSDFATICNAFIEEKAPWKLSKDPAKADSLDEVLYSLAESLRIIAILISPILPQAARGIFDQLDPEQKLSREFRLEDTRWGVLGDGHIVGKPVPLFPRIEQI